MDAYTAQTKLWLNARFRKTSPEGVYLAHQNIYGFKNKYTLDGTILRYVIFINVVKALSMLRFDSLLDVGGAEGYMAAAIRKFFDARTRTCDLSDEACNRAREIFGLDADPVDGHQLPYPDGAFDVVLSSESIEHMPDYRQVVNELLRVARRAVIITVPHDGPAAIAANVRNGVTHGHLHDFTLDSLRDIVPPEYRIIRWGLWTKFFRLPYRLVEGSPIDYSSRRGVMRLVVRGLNPLVAVTGRVLGRRAFKALLALDGFLSNWVRAYRQLVFVVVKDPGCIRPGHETRVTIDAILDFSVPPNHLDGAASAAHSVTAG
ncbi:MAG: class I SAM-dependent methyltransferase [Gemmatimonadales bacterium]